MPSPEFVLRHRFALSRVALGDFEGARNTWLELVAQAPDDAMAQYHVGLTWFDTGEHGEAAVWFEKVVLLRPDWVPGWLNLGLARLRGGNPEAARVALERAVTLDADHYAGWLGLGTALARSGRQIEAVAALRRAHVLRPQESAPLAALGDALGTLCELPAAIDALRSAITLEPGSASLWWACGSHLSSLGLHAEATACLRHAHMLDPSDSRGHSALLLQLHYAPEIVTRDEMFAEHRRWAELHASDARSGDVRSGDVRSGDVRSGDVRSSDVHSPRKRHRIQKRRLRVGYLSPRFGEGPLASFFLPVLEGHDPREFEVFLYSAYPHRSPLAERMRAACRDWRDLPASDEHAMAMLRVDDLDVLVDLAGHTPGGRLAVLARRAAPVQVTWLDWFDTTGLSAIDYLLSDSVHTPENFAPYFSERLVLMRECRFVYRPVVAPLASIAPSSRNGYVTFGCFNRHAKISDDAIRLWSRVLESVPDARLHLRASAYGGAGTVDHVRARWRAMGVPVERIEFLPYVPLREALASYANIDIALDPFPYNGGVTTCDALAHGVPVVALVGDTMIARQSAALLQAARRPQWIAATPDDYVRVACDLARPDAIAGTRADLFNTFAHSPLCDVAGFVTALETTLDHLCQLGSANGDRHPPLVCA